jgi:hypothetical protein
LITEKLDSRHVKTGEATELEPDLSLVEHFAIAGF